MNTIFYEKIGNKYVPLKEYDERIWRSFSEGEFLVHSRPGSLGVRKIKAESKEEFEVLATLIKYEDEVYKNLQTNIQVSPKPITKEQVKAWENLEKKLKNKATLTYPSYQDMMDELKKSIINKLMSTKKHKLLLIDEICFDK